MTTQNQMRAVQISQDHRVEVIETAVPKISDEEVLIKTCNCGICGTDLHIMQHGFPGTNYPIVPGHEFAGYVVEVGKRVKSFREGDFIAADPNVVCGNCRWCRAKRPNLCPNLSPIGVGRPGAAAEYVNVPASNIALVKEDLGGELAALIEPLACVLHAIESSQGVKDKQVLVFGGGTMGMLIAIVSKLFGADRVVLTDPTQTKCEIALKAGVDEAVKPEDLSGICYDVVFEAAGVGSALKQAFGLVEKTGVLVQVGVHEEHATTPLNPFKIYEREIRIIGSNSCADKFFEAVDVMYEIKEKAALLIGQSYEVWDFKKAIEEMSSGQTIKTQLRI